MRIVNSKIYDIYDYLQDYDDTIIFDRKDSFMLTKDIVFDALYYTGSKKQKFVLMQCGVRYWLFLVTLEDNSNYTNKNFDTELLATWKNYNRGRAIIKIDTINFYDMFKFYEYRKGFNHDKLIKDIDSLVNNINTGNYNVAKSICPCKMYNRVYNIPILKSSGLIASVNPEDIFYAIEEYFSLEKTANERTVANGTTNNDKITSHGFDLKTSFRGK